VKVPQQDYFSEGAAAGHAACLAGSECNPVDTWRVRPGGGVVRHARVVELMGEGAPARQDARTVST
jgi:hypothetical protein